MKLINVIILIMSMTLASFAAWDGKTIKQPSIKAIDGRQYYAIGTPEELAWFANEVNSGDSVINAILIDDIDLNMQFWKPIGYSESIAYDGIFDGNGHCVFGFNVSGYMYAGFFGVLDAGCIKNLTIGKSSIQGYYKKTVANSRTYESFIGGLVAYAKPASQIENSINKLNIVAPSELSNVNKDDEFILYMGGIAGLMTGFIKDCVNTGNVISSSANIRYVSKSYLGGIAGKFGHSCNMSEKSLLENYGNVSGGGYTGGISGFGLYGSSSFESDINLTALNFGVVAGKHYVGGIFGYGSESAAGKSLFINYGNISIDSTHLSLYVGGLFGYFENKFSKVNGVNYGNIQAESDSSIYLGGAIGMVSQKIDGVANYGDLKGISKYRSSYVGGVVGTIDSQHSPCITNVFNQGSLISSHYAAGIMPFFPQKENFLDSGCIKNFFVASPKIDAPMSAAFVYSNGVGITIANGYLDSDLLPSIPLIAENVGEIINLQRYSTKQMITDSFAYVLNYNGFGKNIHDNHWSRDDSYPIFVDSSHFAILKISFIQKEDTIVKYTNYKKEIQNIPKNTDSNFIGWYQGIPNEKKDSMEISKHLFEEKDSLIYAAYKGSAEEAQKNISSCLGFMFEKCDDWNSILLEYDSRYGLSSTTVSANAFIYCSDENKNGILNWADSMSVWYSTYNRQNEVIESYKRNLESVSSSSAKGTSSSIESSSSKDSEAVVVTAKPKFYVTIFGCNVQIANAKVGSTYALFDMQGKVLMQDRVTSTNFNVAVPRSGNYLLRIGNRTERVIIR